MKHIVIFLIKIYQVLLSPILHVLLGTPKACRYQETCSVYAIRVIREKGLVHGGFLTIRRLMSCHPFAKPAL